MRLRAHKLNKMFLRLTVLMSVGLSFSPSHPAQTIEPTLTSRRIATSSTTTTFDDPGGITLNGPRLLWKERVHVSSRPDILGGALYFDGGDKTLVSVDAKTGQVNWRYKAEGSLSNVVGDGDTVYFSSENGKLISLDARAGTVEWVFAGQGEATGTIALAEGRIFFGSGNSLYAVDATTGRLKWEFHLDGKHLLGATYHGGVVYYVSGIGDSFLYALDAQTGHRKWVYTGLDFLSSPVTDGRYVYFGGYSDGGYTLLAVNADTGLLRWAMPGDHGFVFSPPAVDGAMAYFNDGNGDIYGLDKASGEKKWGFRRSKHLETQVPSIQGDTVYFGVANTLVAVEGQTGREHWRISSRGEVNYSAAADNLVYFSSDDGYLYAAEVKTQVSPVGALCAASATEEGEKLLGVITAQTKVDDDDIVFSPHGDQVGYVILSDKGYWNTATDAVFGNVENGEYFIAFAPLFSPNCHLAAYRFEDHNLEFFAPSRWAVALADYRGAGLRSAVRWYNFAWDPVFSPDGRQIVYVASKDAESNGVILTGEKWFVVSDDKEGPEFNAVAPPVFSPDSKRIAYAASKGGFIRYRTFSGTGNFSIFDASPVLFGAPEAPFGKWFMVIDGQKSKEFAWVAEPVFSPDSKQAAYIAMNLSDDYSKERWFVVREGQEGKSFGAVWGLVFSPDGQQVAYAASKKQGEKAFVVVGNKEGPKFDAVSNLAFSPDSKQVAYVAMRGKQWSVVINSDKGKKFDAVGAPVFSPDSQQVAYFAKSDGKWFVVQGGSVGEGFDEIKGSARHGSGFDAPIYSPDGKIVTYRARKNNRWFIVAGDKRGEEFDFVSPPIFSVDGKKVLYGARKGNELWWKVLEVGM